MSKQFVFDQPYTMRITQARQNFLREVLPGLREQLALHSALDVGCGVGYFSAFLHDLGLTVEGLDGRECNVEEAKKRIPEVVFHLMDVEEPSVRVLGPRDLVLCFGLLYHLESPMRAIHNLHALTTKLLLIESMCAPETRPCLCVLEENAFAEDQGLRSLAFYPSESCLVRMLYRAGFPFVWRWTKLPAHEDFQESLSCKRKRTMLVASTVSLDFPLLVRAREPGPDSDLWKNNLGRMSHLVTKLAHFVAKPWPEKADTLQRHLKRTTIDVGKRYL